MSLREVADFIYGWTNGDLWTFGLSGIGPVCGLILFSLQRWWQGRVALNDRVVKAGGSVILSSHLKEYGYWWLTYSSRALIAFRVHPTTVTLAGMGVVMVGSVFVGMGYFGLGGLFILLGSLSDMLDGMVARALGMTRVAGEFIDSLTDRYTDMAVFGGLMAHFLGRPYICLCIGLAAFGSTTVSYARAKAESLGVKNVPRGPMQRAERAVLLGFGIFFSPSFARHTIGEGTTNWLVVAICALIATLANVSAIQMARFTTQELDRRALASKGEKKASEAHAEDQLSVAAKPIDRPSASHA